MTDISATAFFSQASGEGDATGASATDFFREATTHPGPSPESYARQDGEDFYDHENRVQRGLSLGHLTTEQAAGHGHYQGSDWKPLPSTLYHTTTDAAGVAEHGLKTGRDLGQRRGHGLGGSPQYLSLTDSAEHAHAVLHHLHEYHDVVHGKTSMADMVEAAKRGDGASEPYHERLATEFGRKDLEHALKGQQYIHSTFTDEDAHGLKPSAYHERVKDWQGNDAGKGWVRDFKPEEHQEQTRRLYDLFSYARSKHGGPGHVFFSSNDHEAFAKKDPSNFAVLKVRPKPGAQGFENKGEHEWRTGTGDAVETHGEPLRRTSARIGQAVRPFEHTASAQTWYTVRHYDAENIARHRNPNRRTYADLNEAQGHADQITQREGLPGVTMVNTTHPDQSGYVHSHPHAGGGSIIGLGRNALDEGVLIHEMTHHLLHHKSISTDDHHAPAFGEHLGRMLDDHHSDPGAGPAFRDALQQTDHQMRTNPGGTSHSFKAPYPQMPAAEHKPSSNDRGTTPQRPAGPAAPPGPQPDDRPRGTIQLRSAAESPHWGEPDEEGVDHGLPAQAPQAIGPVYHATRSRNWPPSADQASHLHFGTLQAARDRTKNPYSHGTAPEHTGPWRMFETHLHGPVHPNHIFDDEAQEVPYTAGADTSRIYPYRNESEDEDSTSFLAPRHTLKRWREVPLHHTASLHIAAGSELCPDCRGEGEDAQGRECDPCDGQGHVTTPVPDNDKPYEHEHDWLPPREHFFAPTADDLDPRLFDGDRIRPEVRYALLGALNDFWEPKYGPEWQSWARVYLAGSEASKFTGRNNDLDVLIGVDYDAARHHVDALTGETDREIDTKLTDELREGLNSDDRMLPGPGGKETGPYESTWYVNPDSWDLKKLKPYAAYDLTNDQWEVRPVTTPADFGPTKLPESTWDVVDALRALIKAIGELPEGTREREGAALWDYLHGDRHAAFGPDGTGLYDPANISWKALDGAPGHPLQQLIDWKHSHDGAAATQEEAA